MKLATAHGSASLFPIAMFVFPRGRLLHQKESSTWDSMIRYDLPPIGTPRKMYCSIRTLFLNRLSNQTILRRKGRKSKNTGTFLRERLADGSVSCFVLIV